MNIQTRDSSAILVADVGGTFGRFSIAEAGRVVGELLTLARDGAPSLAALCAEAIRQLGFKPAGAAIAVAGPVSQGHGILTNVGWTFSEAALERDLALERVVLVNDFSALALTLPDLTRADLVTVAPHVFEAVSGRSGATSPHVRVVFGPGTGLGVAALWECNGERILIDSEGGHAGFAPATDLERALLLHAQERFTRVSWERVLSGPGLQLIDEVCRESLGTGGGALRTPRDIVEAALGSACPAAKMAIDCFSGLLASFAGDLAMTFRASAGVYVGGGLAGRMLSLVSFPLIRERFHDKGRHAEWLDTVPLYFIRNPQAALIGATVAFARR
ncbi:MAG: glucokinase [Burkholderiales bacterium]